MARPSTSAVVLTYNGVRWVHEQLVSILDQSIPVDEIVVADDASTDGTQDVVSAVLAGRDRPIVRINHPTNVGVRTNMANALAAASGDVVFLSDQDDRWHPDKVARVLAAITSSSVGLVFTDGSLMDAGGTVTGSTLWAAAGFTDGLQERWRVDPLGVLFAKEVVTGATLAIRRDLALAALPFSEHRWHDSWLALATLLAGFEAVALPELLIDYRLHESNAAGLPSRRWRDRLARHPDSVLARVECILQLREAAARFGADRPEAAASLEVAASFALERLMLPDRRADRVRFVARAWRAGTYQRAANGYRSAVYDLAAPALPVDLRAEARARVLGSADG